MDKKWRLISISIILVAIVFIFWNGNQHSKAATSCYASVSWATSAISQNANATEGWIVTKEAAKASAHCWDTNAGGAMDSKITDTLSFGPQSYTFLNVQHNITCEVTAVAADGTSCNTNGPQTVTVNPAVIQTPPPPTTTPNISADGEYCYFNGKDARNWGEFGSVDWNIDLQPNKILNQDANVCSNASSSNPAFTATGCAGDLFWSGMRSIGGQISYTDQHLDPSQYSVVLNGGSYVNQSFSLSDGVRLSRAELVQNNTYKLSLLKKGTGSVVAQCSVKIETSATSNYGKGSGGGGAATGNSIPGYVSVLSGVFPADGSYTLDSTAGKLSGDFKFAPQIFSIAPPITRFSGQGGDGMSIHLGQHYDNIYFIIGHEPGMVGAWSLSDPFNFDFRHPAPQCLGVGVRCNGPIQWHWPHKSHGVGGVVAEGDSGAVVLDDDGLVPYLSSWYDVQTGTDANGYPIWSVAPTTNGPQGMTAISFSGATPSFGQQIDQTNFVYTGVQPLAAYATPDGNYFGYVQSADQKKVYVLDMSNLTNTANPPYLKTSISINWPDLEDFRVTNIPDSDTQFALGLSGKNLKIGKIDNQTGKVGNVKTFPVTKSITANLNNQSILSTTVNGATYVFILEKIDKTLADYIAGKTGKMTIGEYLMGSTGQSLTRKGSITVDGYFDGFNGNGIQNSSHISGYTIRIIPSKSGDMYPFLAVGTATTIGYSYLANPSDIHSGMASFSYTVSGDILFYSLKNLLQKGGDLSPKPDLSVPNPWPSSLDKGAIFLNTASTQGFLDDSSGKTYLYLYRAASQWNGLIHGDSLFEGYPATSDTTNRDWMYLLNSGAVMGNPTVRADRIDVTSLVGASATTPTTPNPTTTTNTGNPPPSTIGSGGDCYTKYKDNIQLVDLCEQIESLKQQVCQKAPTISFCSSPQVQ